MTLFRPKDGVETKRRLTIEQGTLKTEYVRHNLCK
jgi:hypothetical protein